LYGDVTTSSFPAGYTQVTNLEIYTHLKCKCQNGFKPDNQGGLVWYTDGSKANEGTGTRVYKWGLRRGHSLSIGLYTTVLQAEKSAIKACIMENTENSYTGRNTYILSYSQNSHQCALHFPDKL
jgi:hypothetical protein